MPAEQTLDVLLRRDPQLRFRLDHDLKVVTSLRGTLCTLSRREQRNPEPAARRFLREHGELFGRAADSTLTVLQQSDDEVAGRDLVLQQHHGPYVVVSGTARFHWSPAGVLESVRNGLFPDLAAVPRQPRIDQARAIEAAIKATGAKGRVEREPELLVQRHHGRPTLAWEVRIADTRPGESGAPARWVVLVDATTGRALQHYDNVQTAGPIVGSGTGYYSGAGPLDAYFNNATNQLRDIVRVSLGGPEVRTDDEDGASPSEDPDSNWSDGTTTPRHQNQGAEVDAHRYAADVVDYFQTVHGRNSFDGAGGLLETIVHLGNNFNNGYWDGVKVNLGDGDGVQFDYCTTDDWLAHEFTHAYTQYTCGLQYLNESGALNEAFSDVFAAFITGDWLVFEDNWLLASAPAARNMVDPTNGGSWNVADPINSVLAGHQPGHYTQRYVGGSDNGGVHINSGIINHLFYLLTIGGTHALSGVTVSGIGQSAAEQMLFRCMTVNLVGNPTATFLDFRQAMLDACLDLFPADLFKLSQVKNAFNAVGIGPDLYVRDNLADSGAEPYPGTYLYASPDVINRTAPSANPAADFANLNDDALWENVEFGQDNYVYVRLQNRGSATGDAVINVYFIPMAAFGTPAGWIHVGAIAAAGIAPGTMQVVGPRTFPQALVPAPGHYCMIAVASDPLDPAPDHNLVTSVQEYIDYVRNTNNVAYRNMNVVDLNPGFPALVEFTAGALEGARERYSLEVDLAQAPPGVKVRLHGPRGVLDGAVPRGMKLAARRDGRNSYDVKVGRELAAESRWAGGANPAPAVRYGFEGLLLDRPVRMALEIVLPPEARSTRPMRLFEQQKYRVVVRQRVNGVEVGAFTLRLRLGRERVRLPVGEVVRPPVLERPRLDS